MKLLKELYTIHAPSTKEGAMMHFLKQHLIRQGCNVTTDQAGNLYGTKGKALSYPCIIAHTDEVHEHKPKDYKIITGKDTILGYSPSLRKSIGTGADDKNGIWVALQCLEKYDTLKVAFFVSEEIGCVGSSQADMTFFADCRFVLQCDRKGYTDFVTSIYGTELCSTDFVEDANISAYGYSTNTGALTDAYQLKLNGLEVSTCNICCGYYNPHTDREYTRISQLQNCLALVEHIITHATKTYPHTATIEHYHTHEHELYEYTDDDLYEIVQETIQYHPYLSTVADLKEFLEYYGVYIPQEKLTEIYEQIQENKNYLTHSYDENY